ncbi:glycosyltransferase family 2 protein [Aestuariimicrobium ganziense]|uniref:glycosyltransferase family 2 protein n=1 Tax=Aestuariimicrobium ganziense TaxID=2773677 RepID=UPI001942F427|nr:glycosyltransferase [Aestuariimicrobium ganziense]
MTFSVIIPTLQRSDFLVPLLEMVTRESLVREVIVINNAPTPVSFRHHKLIVLDQPGNIYVNPAWNLGVQSATSDLLCIANDDLLFPPTLFRFARRALRLPIGILTPAASCYRGLTDAVPDDQPPDPGRLRILPVYRRTYGFGSLMFMRRSSYRRIPEEMKIWYGDDYLFEHQKRRNAIFSGFDIETPMSATVGDPQFNPLLASDRAAFMSADRGGYDQRFAKEASVMRRLATIAGRR